MRTRLPIGPYHPLQEEPALFILEVEGERVVDVDWRGGYNHRGIEWLCERKTYDQVLFLVERVCGICSASHPIAFCNAVEDILGIDIPLRAKFIRTVVAELERIQSHLLWLGLMGRYMGYNTIWMWSWKYRESVLDIFERIAGNRRSYAIFRVGGVRRDIGKEDYRFILGKLNDMEPKVETLAKAILDDPVISARLKVGRLKKEDAIRYCVVGPTARGAGVDIDVRRDEPYAAYDLIDWKVITKDGGDVLSMASVRVLEILESIKMVRECIKNMPGGPVYEEVPDIPPGEGIGRGEAPRGECLHYVVSDGTNIPKRVKIRAPSFMNIPSFKARVVGETVSDVILILASVDPCYSCAERRIVAREGRRIMDYEELLKKSWEKTERMRREIGV